MRFSRHTSGSGSVSSSSASSWSRIRSSSGAPEMATILVTGGEGFLGTRAVEQLRRAGHDVVTADIKRSATYVGDLADPEFTQKLPDADVVVHAAAVQYVTPTIPLLRRAAWFERNNVLATRNLVDRYDGRAEYFLQIGTSMM